MDYEVVKYRNEWALYMRASNCYMTFSNKKKWTKKRIQEMADRLNKKYGGQNA